MKKALALILAVLLVSACGQTQRQTATPAPQTPGAAKENVTIAKDGVTEFYTTGLPIVDPGTVTVSIMANTTAADPNTFPMVQRYTEDTGIDFEWITVSGDAVNERKGIMWASGEYPHILGPSVPSEADISTYGPQGIIIALNEYIDKYLVSMKENIGGADVWEATWSKLKYPDGSIYTYPTITDYFYTDSTVPTINMTWLDALGLSVPETPDEFVEVLKAFKTQDPNGNGLDDEIPLVAVHWKGIGDLYAVAGWTGALTTIRYIENGEMVWPFIGEETREAAKWLNMLWNERLIDFEQFTTDENDKKAKAQAETLVYGAAVMWREGNFFGETNAVNYYPMKPLKAADGSRRWYGTHDLNLVMNQWVVTSSCPYPEIVARFVDYLYIPEITIQSDHAPLEIGYDLMEDGTWKRKTPEGFATVGEFFIDNHFQQVPRLAIGKYISINWQDPERENNIARAFAEGRLFDGNTVIPQKNIHDLVLHDYIITPPPPIKPTPEETEIVNMYSADFNRYIGEALSQFVTGDLNTDADWDRYVEQVKRLGYDELFNVYKGQYERYLSFN